MESISCSRLGKVMASYQTSAKAAAECKMEAYKWFRLTSAQGYPGSVEAFEQVALSLTHEQVLEGNHRADLYASANTPAAQSR
jgi:hypothetical protein